MNLTVFEHPVYTSHRSFTKSLQVKPKISDNTSTKLLGELKCLITITYHCGTSSCVAHRQPACILRLRLRLSYLSTVTVSTLTRYCDGYQHNNRAAPKSDIPRIFRLLTSVIFVPNILKRLVSLVFVPDTDILIISCGARSRGRIHC